MKSCKLARTPLFKRAILSLGALALVSQHASAQITIESWENTLDGWTVPPAYNLDPNYLPTAGFSTTLGVTDGSYSLAVSGNGTAGPNYGPLLVSPTTTLLTSELGSASTLSFDVYAPSGSFGYFLQFDVDINNADTVFVSLDSYGYPGVTIGAESTITVPISASLRTILAASSNPTTLDMQVGGGYTAGNETFYLDNLRLTVVPEPSVFSLLGAAATGFGFLLRRTSSVASAS